MKATKGLYKQPFGSFTFDSHFQRQYILSV